MPDSPESGGAAPAPAQPQEFQVPEGKALIDADEYEQLRQTVDRNRHRLSGYEQRFNQLKKLGLDDDEAIRRLSDLNRRISERKINVDHLLNAFDAPGGSGDTGSGSSASGGLDVDSIKSQVAESVREELRREQLLEKARQEHAQSGEAARKRLRDLVAQTYGEGVAPEKIDFTTDALWFRAEQQRYKGGQLYPEGHPLHGQAFRHMTEDELAAFHKQWAEQRAKAKAAATLDKGNKVNRAASTPAGEPGGEGPPATEGRKTRPGGLPPEEEVEAYLREREARRSKAATSSLGS